jgi:phosphopentomutase
MLGVTVPRPWHVFPDATPAIPVEWIDAWCAAAGLPGVLGNCRASGTDILVRWGEASLRTGYPIVYTSGDSVIQIAAPMPSFGLDRLMSIAQIARRMADAWPVARIITRPFESDGQGGWRRTADRHDLAVPPPARLAHEDLADAGWIIHGIGKIPDILGHRAIHVAHPAADNAAAMAIIEHLWSTLPAGHIILANLNDFDTRYGHRRDPVGYAHALAAFDAAWGDVMAHSRPGDLAMLTADHGNDPTAAGTDHTREWVPWLARTWGAALPDEVKVPRGHAIRHDGFDLVATALRAWHRPAGGTAAPAESGWARIA